MNEQKYLFSQLAPAEQTALADFYKGTNEANFRESRNAAWELAKVLLTVNSGAAAGLFIVVRSSTENPLLTFSFYTFCFGVFFVIFAYFIGAVQFSGNALKWEEGVQNVIRDKLSINDLIEQQRKRMRGAWSKTCGILGGLSFLCIVTGGLTAGRFLVETSSSKILEPSKPLNYQSISITNLISKNTNVLAPK